VEADTNVNSYLAQLFSKRFQVLLSDSVPSFSIRCTDCLNTPATSTLEISSTTERVVILPLQREV